MLANGIPVISARVNVPSFGSISGQLELGAEIDPGPLTLNDSVHVLAKRVQVFAGRAYVVLDGGSAGGLSAEVPAKHFKNATGAQVLSYILGKAGETQSPVIGPDVLAQTFGFYGLQSGTARAVLGDLARELGVDWRTLYDGTIWLGTGEPVPNPAAPEMLDWSPAYGHATFADELTLTPGQDLGFGPIVRVEFETGETSRALVWS